MLGEGFLHTSCTTWRRIWPRNNQLHTLWVTVGCLAFIIQWILDKLQYLLLPAFFSPFLFSISIQSDYHPQRFTLTPFVKVTNSYPGGESKCYFAEFTFFFFFYIISISCSTFSHFCFSDESEEWQASLKWDSSRKICTGIFILRKLEQYAGTNRTWNGKRKQKWWPWTITWLI